MSSLDSNPAVQVLGLEHENPYVRETFLFFYAVTIVQGIKSKNLVHTVALALNRAFGSYGFLLPLVLGGLPSKTYQSFDSYLLTLVGAIFFVQVILDRFVPSNISVYLEKPCEIAYSVVKGNAAGHGFVMVAAALPDSVVAPFAGAYLAVNGHRILEQGVSAFAVSYYDNDSLLGVVGGAIYFALIEYVRVSSLVARVALIVFHISCSYVDYNSMIETVTTAVGKVGGSSSGSSKRSRSKTPKRK
jgi:hypothetical protein